MSRPFTAPTVGHVPSPDLTMRKLLRCKRTKAFLARDGTWTDDVQKALRISEPTVPPELRDLAKAEEFEIYYSFDQYGESQYDFTLSAR